MKTRILLVLFLIGLFLPLTVAFSEEKKSEVFGATAVTTTGTGRRVSIKIYINSYTPDEEVVQLANLLKTQGPDATLNALHKMDRGRLAPIRKTGTTVGFIRTRPTDNGGRHITMIMERPIGFVEFYRSVRSQDYPFGILEMDFDKDGKGSGTLAVAAKISFADDNSVKVENYGISPMRLMGLNALN